MLALPAEQKQTLRRMLALYGIESLDHPALTDRQSLGRFLVELPQPDRARAPKAWETWRDARRPLSPAGGEALRRLLEESPSPCPAETDSEPAPPADGEVEATPPTLPAAPATPPPRRPPFDSPALPTKPVTSRPAPIWPDADSQAAALRQIRELAEQNRYIEAFVTGVRQYETTCDEQFVEACSVVSHLASVWDRDRHVAPYPLFDPFYELARALGKHVAHMRRFDEDPLRATSHLYRHATKIYTEWVDHCEAVLEHNFHRTNTAWQKREWIQPQDFSCLLQVLRSAVHEKMPLDLLNRVYERIREALKIGDFVIHSEKKRRRFEGDCLRVFASPTKDAIPDLCYRIYRDIITAYAAAGETASALIFCRQVLLINRGDREMLMLLEELQRNAAREQGRRPAQDADPSPFD